MGPIDQGIVVRTGGGAYPVLVGSGLLLGLGELMVEALGRTPKRAMIVADAGVPSEVAEEAARSVEGRGVGVFRIRFGPSEQAKTLRTLERLVAEAAGAALERSDPIVALGGGVVGDLAGFAAATYRRGAPVVQCPTTLLAMVDASVGGKTGVNLEVGGALLKNMVGAFHQPTMVVADVRTLGSLSDRQMSAGLAECLKHGLLAAEFGDPGLLDWTVERLEAIRAREPGVLTELVVRNVRVKAAVVGEDEKELAPEGGRALLNLGHTFAHAIETLDGLSFDGRTQEHLLHGEAVGLGLLAAAVVGTAVGSVPGRVVTEVEQALGLAGLPGRVHGLPEGKEIIARMRHDKKVRDGALRLVLPADGRRAVVRTDVPEEVISWGIDRIRAGRGVSET